MAEPHSAPATTPLAGLLAERIRREGPLPLSHYMTACLQHPEHGYYRQGDVLGRQGDFITAPEISQCFGEVIGGWIAVAWQQLGAPERWCLVELGPGRGTLLADALRVLRRMPAAHAGVRIHLAESSPTFRASQAAAVGEAAGLTLWHEDATAALGAAIAAGLPIILVANEFLDALPIEQHLSEGDAWRRIAIGCDGEGRLIETTMAADRSSMPTRLSAGVPAGSIVEHSPDIGQFVVGDLARAAAATPTVALLIDYGHTASAIGATLQAVRAHRSEPITANPGLADLSAQVDFAAVAASAAAAGLAVHGPVLQAELLGRLGIVERASRLMAANPRSANGIEYGVRRLLEPNGMGGRFKAIALASPGLPTPPGFEAREA